MEKQMAIFIDNLYGVAFMTFEFNSQGDLSNVNENFSYNKGEKIGKRNSDQNSENIYPWKVKLDSCFRFEDV